MAEDPLEQLVSRAEQARDTRDAGDPLGAIRATVELQAGMLSTYDELVVRARDAGHSWKDIGEALGVTAQAAHQRFADLASEMRGTYLGSGPTPPVSTTRAKGAERIRRRSR